MLYNDEERAIMASAIQPNMRLASVAVRPFEAIVRDFFDSSQLALGALDIGPGQCDFLDLVRKAGGRTIGVDFDAAVCALGRLRGHEMHQHNLQRGWPAGLPATGGVFCRGSINFYWFARNAAALEEFLAGLGSAVAAAQWTWIVPWNQPAKLAPADVDEVPARLERWRRELGLACRQPDDADLPRYGIGYKIPRVEIWTKGLTHVAPAESAT